MKKHKTLGLLLMIFALVLTACQGEAPEGEEAAQDGGAGKGGEDLTELTFVLDYTPNTNHTGLYVAQAKDFFKEEGLKVDIVQPPEDGAAGLVGAGNAEFGMDYQDNLAPALSADHPIPVTSLAAIIQHNTSGLISLASNPVNRPKDLEGKSYATWGAPIAEAIINNTITTDGGDPDKVKVAPAPEANIYNMEGSDYDAVWIYYAWDGISAEVNKIDFAYYAMADINPTFDYYTPVIIGNNDFIKENPDTTKAFLRAVEKGYKFAIDNPEEAGKILMEAAPELDEKTVMASQKYLADKYIDDAKYWGYIDQDRWDRFYDWLYEEDLVKREIPAGHGFTNDYLPGNNQADEA